jgi:hypothetical protein
VFINNCATLSAPALEVHDALADPAPNMVSVDDEVA